MLYITFMSLKSFFPIFHIFRNISTSLFKLYSLCIRADGIVLVTHSRDLRTVHGCPYPLVVIRREISVRNSC